MGRKPKTRDDEESTAFRRLSTLVNRYLLLGQQLQKCVEFLPGRDPEVIEVSRFLAIAHFEITQFEFHLGELIDESMVLHEELRQRRKSASHESQKKGAA